MMELIVVASRDRVLPLASRGFMITIRTNADQHVVKRHPLASAWLRRNILSHTRKQLCATLSFTPWQQAALILKVIEISPSGFWILHFSSAFHTHVCYTFAFRDPGCEILVVRFLFSAPLSYAQPSITPSLPGFQILNPRS